MRFRLLSQLNSKSMLHFVVVVVESSVTVVYPRSDQSSTGGLDNFNGLLCVQRGLKSKPSRNKAKIFASMVEPEANQSCCRIRLALLAYLM